MSKKIPYSSPTIDHMYQKDKANYIAERAGISCFVAAHRGNYRVVNGLIEHGIEKYKILVKKYMNAVYVFYIYKVLI